MADFTVDVLDASFEAQTERLSRLVEDGRVTPELGSILLSYYAMGRAEASGEVCDVKTAAKSFNPNHDKTMQLFRGSRPAGILLNASK